MVSRNSGGTCGRERRDCRVKLYRRSSILYIMFSSTNILPSFTIHCHGHGFRGCAWLLSAEIYGRRTMVASATARRTGVTAFLLVYRHYTITKRRSTPLQMLATTLVSHSTIS